MYFIGDNKLFVFAKNIPVQAGVVSNTFMPHAMDPSPSPPPAANVSAKRSYLLRTSKIVHLQYESVQDTSLKDSFVNPYGVLITYREVAMWHRIEIIDDTF
jgi:hypothetical protein